MTNKPITSSSAQETWLSTTTASTTSMAKLVDLVKYPVMNQKTMIALFKNAQYTFDVDVRLTKPQIKKLFETLFTVNVVAINTHIPPRKKIRVGMAQGFRPRYKRAILTLKEGQSINYVYKMEKTEQG
jgi:large subunit ribosomal protein L23